MHRRTRDRIAWALCPFLAGVALGGTGLLAMPANRERPTSTATPPALPFFFFDLEENPPHAPRDPRGPLRLVVEPVRVGKAGLLVRVEVWNPSVEDKLVHPIYPAAYQLSFRDAAGALVEAYLLPPAYGVIQDQAEFARVGSGNCLAANYMLPTFYKRIRKKNLQCRVQIGTIYTTKPKSERPTFELSSEWVKVPPP
jgi:hypothetical protein